MPVLYPWELEAALETLTELPLNHPSWIPPGSLLDPQAGQGGMVLLWWAGLCGRWIEGFQAGFLKLWNNSYI